MEGQNDTRGPAPPALSWRDAILAWRDKLLSDKRFQRWAARFPLTRGIAATRARALFDIGAGFVYSQIYLACVRLRLFERLADGPREIADLAREMALPPESADRLLRGAAALGLVERRGPGRYGLGVLGAAYLGNPGLADLVEHHRMLYADLADPVALLRGEAGSRQLARYWAYAGHGGEAGFAPAEVEAYSRLMAASQAMLAEDILEVLPLGRVGTLLDVGGGEGAFAAAAAARAPHVRLTLFDLPAVAARARLRFEALGIEGRASAIGGNFLEGPLPVGADMVTLVRVLHDHDDDAALAILRQIRSAISRIGRLVVAEPMAGTPGAETVGDAYFGFYLLAMGQGRPRTPAELTALLARAGFGRARVLRTRRPILTGVLLAEPTNLPE